MGTRILGWPTFPLMFAHVQVSLTGVKVGSGLTLLGLGLIKINDVSANLNNPRPSLILNN